MAATPSSLVVILLGPPGAGKGTQAKMIQERWKIPHISTGDLFRGNIRKGTELGHQVKQFMDQGKLVPDSLVLNILFERVKQDDCAKGYILDGVPRTVAQAEAVQRFLDTTIPIVIDLDLSKETVIQRLTKRVVCQTCGTPYHLLYSPPKITGRCDQCGGTLIQRTDDTEEVVLKRLQVYEQQTAPLIAFYQKLDLLKTVDCSTDKENVFSQITKILSQ